MFCEDLFKGIANSKAAGEKIEFEVSSIRPSYQLFIFIYRFKSFLINKKY